MQFAILSFEKGDLFLRVLFNQLLSHGNVSYIWAVELSLNDNSGFIFLELNFTCRLMAIATSPGHLQIKGLLLCTHKFIQLQTF
jgi:hypothetical protein